MKKVIVNFENPNGIEVEMTPEEIAAKEARDAANATKRQEQLDKDAEKENLKASAKAKLIAGEKLTEEEANILVGV